MAMMGFNARKGPTVARDTADPLLGWTVTVPEMLPVTGKLTVPVAEPVDVAENVPLDVIGVSCTVFVGSVEGDP
jgi:hypothetical protein